VERASKRVKLFYGMSSDTAMNKCAPPPHRAPAAASWRRGGGQETA
jgi:hypothetical protein